jgi:hypothetical protein
MGKQTESAIIAELKRDLTTAQRASLLASKVGDFAKSAAMAAQAVQISKSIAREEGLPPIDFFTPDDAAAA